jgi:putative membrane protein
MQRAFLILGLLTLGAAWFGPLPELAREAFFAHMTMHMAVVAVAAPLLAAGVRGGPADLARRAPRVFAPVQASIAELIIVWAWHTPALHHAARQYTAAFIAEQGSFLIAGWFLWLASLGGDSLNKRNRNAAGIVALLLTAMHMTLLGALLALSPRPLYAHAGEFSGLTALDDQHLGGAIMLLVGGVAYLCGGLWLTLRLLRESSAAPLGRPWRG